MLTVKSFILKYTTHMLWYYLKSSSNPVNIYFIIKMKLVILYFVPSVLRGAQSQRPVSVSRGALHAANHRVSRLRPKHRWCPSQRSPQCTAVPQNHGRREMTSVSAPLPHRLELTTTKCHHKFLLWMTEALLWWTQITWITSNLEMKTLYAPRFFKSPIDDANEDLVAPPQKNHLTFTIFITNYVFLLFYITLVVFIWIYKWCYRGKLYIANNLR